MIGIFEKIIGYVKSLVTKTTSKKQVLESLELSMTSLESEIRPSIETAIHANVNSSSINRNVLNILVKYAGAGGDYKAVLNKIKLAVTNVLEKEKDIKTAINNYMSNVVASDVSSPRDMAFIKFVGDINSLTLATMDVLELLFTSDPVNDTEYTKPEVTAKINAIYEYAELVKFFSNAKQLSTTISDFKEITNELVDLGSDNSGEQVSMLASVIGGKTKSIILPNTNGFVNNPIYHIRMWITDLEKKKFDKLAEKKKMFALIILKLENEKNGTNDEKLNNEIAWYQKEISKIEYEMAKLETA